jgi:hypothetical protein
VQLGDQSVPFILADAVNALVFTQGAEQLVVGHRDRRSRCQQLVHTVDDRASV